MKFLIAFVLTILLSFAGALYFPWWIIAVAAFIVAAFIPQQPFKSFLTGFIALFILWGAQAFFIDSQNHHLLATRVASILPLGGSYIVLILVTAFIGGLVAAMAALSGSLLRKVIRKNNETSGDFETRKIVSRQD